MQAVRVVTFNVRNTWGRDRFNHWVFRRGLARRAIDAGNCDVIALQELRFNQYLYFRLRLWRFRVYSRARDDGGWRGEHCPLFVRRSRFAIRDRLTCWLSDTPAVAGSRHWGNAVPRIVNSLVLKDRSSGRIFGVLNTHFDERSEAVRNKSAQQILDYTMSSLISDWILLGDLNATPRDPSVMVLLQGGFTDALAHLPAVGRGAATNHDFTGRVDGTRIDHVLATSGWRVISSSIDHRAGRLPSDHWPVRATLELA